jgi:hypothetical protein
MLVIFAFVYDKQFSGLLVNLIYVLQLILFIKIGDTKVHRS